MILTDWRGRNPSRCGPLVDASVVLECTMNRYETVILSKIHKDVSVQKLVRLSYVPLSFAMLSSCCVET